MKKTLMILVGSALILSISAIYGCKKDDKEDPPVPVPQETHGWISGGIANGFGTILYTNDGETWIRQGDSTTIPEAAIDNVFAYDKNLVWAVGANANGYGTILKTTNGGLSWSRQGAKGNIPYTDFSGVRAISKDIAWAVGDSAVIMKTSDGGATWVRQAEGLFPSANYQAIASRDAEHIWVVGSINNDSTSLIIFSGDGGNTWERQAEAIVQPDDLYILDVHAYDDDNVWTVGRNAVFITSNGGTSWMRKDGPLHGYDNNGICVLGATKAIVAADYCNIGLTTNQGDTWNDLNITCTALYGNYILGITALDENNIWAVNANGDPNEMGSIFRSTDGGNTWKKLICPFNVNFRRISFAGDLRR